MKSIVVIGKGPSVRRSSKEFIDSFDEVAICNHPPYSGHEHLISNRANYHFLNAGDPHPYERHILDGLGITHIFNTSRWEKPPVKEICPSQGVEYYHDFGVKTIEDFKKYGFDEWGPSSGIQAFSLFVDNEEYNKIALVGFDFFQKGKKNYYFEKEEANPSLHYLWNNGTYSPDGTVMKSTHGGPEKTIDYILNKMTSLPDKEFLLMTDYDFENSPYELGDKLQNLKLL